jgi:hypothetical protein
MSPKPRTRDEVKSDEEYHMTLWLNEAVEFGLVEDWDYEPKSFELLPERNYLEVVQKKTKTSVVEKHLHQSANYTPDFRIAFTALGENKLLPYYKKSMYASNNKREIFVDIKGSYSPHQNEARYFSLVQKLMMDKLGIWVQKVIPYAGHWRRSLFCETFAPSKLRHKLNGSINACGERCKSVQEFIK